MKKLNENEVASNSVGSGNISGTGNSQSDPPVKNWAKRLKSIRKNILKDRLLRR